MAIVIHHAVVKRATKLGVEFVETPDGGFRLKQDGKLSEGSWDSAKEALDEFANLGAEFVWEVRAKGNRCGVMVASYHDRYEHNPHGPGCGDGLDCAMRDAFTNVAGHVNRDALRECGEAAGIWNDRWDSLNPGMARMNCANRIRALLRNDEHAKIKIGDKTGRFGVAFKPAGRKAKVAQAA